MIEISDTRVFDQRLQDAFADLSCDYNPKHVDPARARTMFFGRQVVHGLHLVLRSLDLIAGATDMTVLESVSCTFAQACEPGRPVTISARCDGRKATVEVRTLDARAARFVFLFRDQAPAPAPRVFDRALARPAVRTLEAAEIEGQAGSVPLTLDAERLAALFPNLSAKGDPGQVAVLLAATRLVGMECPGLYSIFTGLKLQFDGDVTASALNWAVSYWNADLRLMKIKVEAPGVSGAIEAILHPADVTQPSAADVARHLLPDEFAGQHALVVGGSRGLGETVAKIVAMGGGRATITYHSAAEEARRVKAEIEAAGARCEVLRYDVLEAAAPTAPAGPFTQIYYFATPRIRPDAASDDSVRAEYRGVYCDGQARLLDAFQAAVATDAVLYYPSTIFAEQPDAGFEAYAGAKRDGEASAREAASASGLRALVQRLPRLRTGQSSALMGDEALETLPVMLDTVRLVTRLQKERAS